MPVFYLEIPPFLFGRVVKGLAEAGPDEDRARRRREAVRPRPRSRRARSPTSCTSRSTSRSSTASTTTSGRWASRRSSTCASRTRCSSRSGTATTSMRPDHDGRGLRRRGPRPLLRPGRRAARRRRQPPDAGRRRRRDGGALRAATRRRSRTHRSRSSARSTRPTRRTTCAASTTATARSTASRPDSTTETYAAALRLEIENWRWSGVPFFIRTGKRLPVTQTELRLVFKHPPRLGFGSSRTVRAEPARRQARPVDRRPARRRRAARRQAGAGDDHARRGVRGARAARAPTPYEVLLHAALVGDSTRFTRQDGVEETWRIMQPLLDAPPPVHPYAPGSWGPEAAERLVAGHGRWHGPCGSPS